MKSDRFPLFVFVKSVASEAAVEVISTGSLKCALSGKIAGTLAGRFATALIVR